MELFVTQREQNMLMSNLEWGAEAPALVEYVRQWKGLKVDCPYRRFPRSVVFGKVWISSTIVSKIWCYSYPLS